MAGRVTHNEAEVLYSPNSADVKGRVTHSEAEILYSPASGGLKARVTHNEAEILYSASATKGRVTWILIEVLCDPPTIDPGPISNDPTPPVGRGKDRPGDPSKPGKGDGKPSPNPLPKNRLYVQWIHGTGMTDDDFLQDSEVMEIQSRKSVKSNAKMVSQLTFPFY